LEKIRAGKEFAQLTADADAPTNPPPHPMYNCIPPPVAPTVESKTGQKQSKTQRANSDGSSHGNKTET